MLERHILIKGRNAAKATRWLQQYFLEPNLETLKEFISEKVQKDFRLVAESRMEPAPLPTSETVLALQPDPALVPQPGSTSEPDPPQPPPELPPPAPEVPQPVPAPVQQIPHPDLEQLLSDPLLQVPSADETDVQKIMENIFGKDDEEIEFDKDIVNK